MLPPTQIFHHNPSLPTEVFITLTFVIIKVFVFLHSFTTTVQTPKQYSSVGPTTEVYISGIIMHTIFISPYFSHYYVYKHLPCCHELLESIPVPSVYSNTCIYECLFIHSTFDGHHLKHSYFIFSLDSGRCKPYYVVL